MIIHEAETIHIDIQKVTWHLFYKNSALAL